MSGIQFVFQKCPLLRYVTSEICIPSSKLIINFSLTADSSDEPNNIQVLRVRLLENTKRLSHFNSLCSIAISPWNCRYVCECANSIHGLPSHQENAICRTELVQLTLTSLNKNTTAWLQDWRKVATRQESGLVWCEHHFKVQFESTVLSTAISNMLENPETDLAVCSP